MFGAGVEPVWALAMAEARAREGCMQACVYLAFTLREPRAWLARSLPKHMAETTYSSSPTLPSMSMDSTPGPLRKDDRDV